MENIKPRSKDDEIAKALREIVEDDSEHETMSELVHRSHREVREFFERRQEKERSRKIAE